jgi:hypothetical protein
MTSVRTLPRPSVKPADIDRRQNFAFRRIDIHPKLDTILEPRENPEVPMGNEYFPALQSCE